MSNVYNARATAAITTLRLGATELWLRLLRQTSNPTWGCDSTRIVKIFRTLSEAENAVGDNDRAAVRAALKAAMKDIAQARSLIGTSLPREWEPKRKEKGKVEDDEMPF